MTARLPYRATDFRDARAALLRPLDGEVSLRDWHPEAERDVALQLVEWWAYLADILAFYNERALHETFLRSAVWTENMRRIVRLLGYRPRPGIGATGVVAALTDSTEPIFVSRGFALQGAAPSGPQIFETDDDLEVGLLGKPLPMSARFPPAPGGVRQIAIGRGGARGKLRDGVAAAAPSSILTATAGVKFELSLNGVIASVKPAETLLLLARQGNAHIRCKVIAVTPRYNAYGEATTELTLLPAGSLPASTDRGNYRLVRSTKEAHLWTYHHRYAGQAPGSGVSVADVLNPFSLFELLGSGRPENPDILTLPESGRGAAHLEAIVRGLEAGDQVVFEKTVDGVVTSAFLTRVHGYTESIWYANKPQLGGPPPAEPKKEGGGAGDVLGALSFGLLGGGDDDKPVAIPIPHTRITFDDPTGAVRAMGGTNAADIDKIMVRFGWEEVGQMVDAATPPRQTEVDLPSVPGLPPHAPALIEDDSGRGIPGFLGTTVRTTTSDGLQPPLRGLLNLLPVSRGETVRDELLGSGDHTLAGQTFVVSRAPVTYLADTGEHAVDGYRSTLRIRVDGIEWREVPTLYGRQPDERVFVTWEDDEQKTHVRFGDGELGARLPTGVDNVRASYRVGSGAEVPPARTLTTMMRPVSGIVEIRNPVAVGGGADPDPPDQIRRYAPLSVLTFGRAISGDDYEAIAARAPGVRRACVDWGWNGAIQRSTVRVFVGDDVAAVAAAREALQAVADPNVPLVVELASPRDAYLDLVIGVRPERVAADVGEAVRAALLDPRNEPFGLERVTIGGAIYNSQIFRACLRVPGVVAVRRLRFGRSPALAEPAERHTPGPGRFFALRRDALDIVTEVVRDGV